MRDYNVYFEMYGRRMKTTVRAHNKKMAKNIVRQRLNFVKVEEIPDSDVEAFKGMFGIFN